MFSYRIQKLWTLTKLLVNEIDIFQRGVIKKIFNIHWQDKIINVELYEDTNSNLGECSNQRTQNERYGHIQRLNKKTPTRLALKEVERKGKETLRRPETEMDEINWTGSRRIQDCQM